LGQMLQGMDCFTLVGQSDDSQGAIANIVGLKPDVLVLGITAGDERSMKLVRQIRLRLPTVRILVINEDGGQESLKEFAASGALGYCQPTVTHEQLRMAVEAVAQGALWLHSCTKDNPLKAFVRRYHQLERLGPRRVLSQRQEDILKLIVD